MKTSFSCPRTCPAFGDRWCRFRVITDKLGPIKVDSHVAEIKIEVRDLEALAEAARNIGLVFNRGKKVYNWYGMSVGDYPLPEGMTADQLGKCDHSIGVPGSLAAYEVGVIEQADGTYKLVWDFFQGGYGLQELVGKDCSKLTAEYTVVAAERAAQTQGWQTMRQDDGSLMIYHPSGGTLTVERGGKLDLNGFQGQGCHEAMLQLGLPLLNATPKQEYTQVQAQAMCGV